jgi:phage shock protein PspC (stress-responsive transcriptional regulator)
LLTEKQKTEKHVVGVKDVDEVITIMGQPEDYRIDNDDAEPSATNFTNTFDKYKTKRLFRDRENAMIGGVLAGLSHYTGIDKSWLRLILLSLLFLKGFGVLAYIILWIVMPEAKTTSEKLEMRGEPVNISNIEKKVREEFENVSDKIKSTGDKISDEAKNFNAKYGDKINYQAKNAGNSFGDFIIILMGVFAKFIGGLIALIGIGMIVALFVTLFAVGPTTFIGNDWLGDYFNSFNYTNTSLFFIGTMCFLAFGIPFFALFMLGLKIIVPTLKSIGNVARYTLLAVWILSIAVLTYLVSNEFSQVAFDNKTYERQTINLKPTDTLFVKFRSNDYYEKHNKNIGTFCVVEDSVSHKFLYSNDISIEVMATDEKMPYLQIEKSAKGKSNIEAKQRAEKIDFRYKIEGNKLVFDNYFLTDVENKFRGQDVKLFLYLPEGTLIQPDESMEDYDDSDNDFFNMHYSSDKYVYKVKENKVKCLNCPSNENEYNDVDAVIDIENDTINDEININSPNIKINKDGISITSDSTKNNSRDFKELKIDKNGIIIKTK